MSDLLNESVEICDGMVLLPGFAARYELASALEHVVSLAPLRQMETKRGFLMSVRTTNCGQLGWVSDRRGYRYSPTDPVSEKPWPPMPPIFEQLSTDASESAGFSRFKPDACLINQYQPGVQMGAHQDIDEKDFNQPIVSVSLGIKARFFVIGPERRGKSIAVDLEDGDVIVFGGPARKFYHGVRKLKASSHPTWGAFRWNLTLRKAG